MLTYVIIAATVIVSFLCFQNRALFVKLAFSPYQVVHQNRWYQIVSHGFVHADTMHLIVNMITFWSFGLYVERLFAQIGFGNSSFIALYFGGMIVSSLYDLIRFRNQPRYLSVGASGAVSAVLFASILFDPWSKIYLFAIIPIPAILFGVLYLAYCWYMARQAQDNINHRAHFYGAVFGFFFPLLLNPSLIHLFLSHF